METSSKRNTSRYERINLYMRFLKSVQMKDLNVINMKAIKRYYGLKGMSHDRYSTHA